LHTFIKEWAEREGKFDGKKVKLDNYLTQADIAQIIGTSRQTATQLLNEMQEKQLIFYKRKEIFIEDISLL
jgi:CRP/FNR family transcriptional regulator